MSFDIKAASKRSRSSSHNTKKRPLCWEKQDTSHRASTVLIKCFCFSGNCYVVESELIHLTISVTMNNSGKNYLIVFDLVYFVHLTMVLNLFIASNSNKFQDEPQTPDVTDGGEFPMSQSFMNLSLEEQEIKKEEWRKELAEVHNNCWVLMNCQCHDDYCRWNMKFKQCAKS